MHTSIFAFHDYKAFVKAKAKGGRGEITKMAKHLKIHPTRLSQILNGPIDFSSEQACSLGAFLGLNALETEFLLALVQRARAGTKELRSILDKQLAALRAQSRDLAKRLPSEKQLSTEEKSIFYSSWQYSAIRLATSTPTLRTVEALAEHFSLSRGRVRTILDFLLSTGLCIQEKGEVRMGPKTTHLESGSPLIHRHHANWRVRALHRHESLEEDELAYSCPVSLRREDMAEIRERLSRLIEEFIAKITASDPADTLACLNIDWVRIP